MSARGAGSRIVRWIVPAVGGETLGLAFDGTMVAVDDEKGTGEVGGEVVTWLVIRFGAEVNVR